MLARPGSNVSAEQCLAACGSHPACTYWDYDGQGEPAEPAVPAIVKHDHDCAGKDIVDTVKNL